jgi:hypothetical protein
MCVCVCVCVCVCDGAVPYTGFHLVYSYLSVFGLLLHSRDPPSLILSWYFIMAVIM